MKMILVRSSCKGNLSIYRSEDFEELRGRIAKKHGIKPGKICADDEGVTPDNQRDRNGQV